MKAAYDISVLGMGHYHARARTGVFRYVENLACGLAASKECELRLCVVVSWQKMFDALDYLDVNAHFRHVPFLFPKFSGRTDIRGFSNRFWHQLSMQIDDPDVSTGRHLALRVMRYPFSLIHRALDRVPFSMGVDEVENLDLFHSPFFPLPEHVDGAKMLKRFLTVYDLIPILYPQYFAFNESPLVRQALASLKDEDWALCISESTKNDLCNYLKFDPARVLVTYPAAAPTLFHPCSDGERIGMIRAKYNVFDAPYILSVNTLEPRKNIDHAVRSFARLARESSSDLKFVLVGTKGWDYAKIFDAISDAGLTQDRIVLTGFVADEDLAALYSGALAFVYPSFYEGFGLPPLEAMQCGVPVITSNTSSIPEVVGDAAITLDPTDTDGLCQSILKIYNSPSLRSEMSAKSIAQAAKFSWARCTEQTISAYKTALA